MLRQDTSDWFARATHSVFNLLADDIELFEATKGPYGYKGTSKRVQGLDRILQRRWVM